MLWFLQRRSTPHFTIWLVLLLKSSWLKDCCIIFNFEGRSFLIFDLSLFILNLFSNWLSFKTYFQAQITITSVSHWCFFFTFFSSDSCSICCNFTKKHTHFPASLSCVPGISPSSCWLQSVRLHSLLCLITMWIILYWGPAGPCYVVHL